MCSVFGGGRPPGSDVGEAGRLRAALGVTGGKWQVASDERVAKSAWAERGGSTAWTCYPRSRVPGCAQPGAQADIHSLRADIQVMRSAWKSDLGEMKADLHAREARLITWIAGLVVAGAAAAAGVAIAVNQIVGSGVGV